MDPNQPPATNKEESPVDMDTIILDPEEEDVDLVHCRIGKIEGLEVLQKAKTLSLRQNLIKKIENLDSLNSLRELDLYDNQIRKLENLNKLTQLEQLDVSFNVLRKMEGLEQLTRLKKLFLLHNKIGTIANLSHFPCLEMLELGSNRIRVIENLDTLTSLQSLFLGTNKITKLQNMDSLHSLTVLSIQSNRITKMEGLQNLVSLRELYLSHNGIEVIEGLENNKKLTTLDIAANRVKKIENIGHLTELQEFWMNDNQIDNWSDLDELKNAKSLETVYLERNPLQKDPQYRRKIMRKDADAMAVDGGEVYTAGQCGLVPAMVEQYDEAKCSQPGASASSYYAVAVVKKGSGVTWANLRGKKSCHTGFGRTAGWNIPMGKIHKETGDCDFSKYFSSGCAPGSPADSTFCAQCKGSGKAVDDKSKCQASSEEQYYGYAGAFRCLVEGAGDVAFIKHTIVAENSDGKGAEWAKGVLSSDYELICPTKGPVPITDFESCHLAVTPAHAVVTRPETRNNVVAILQDQQGRFGRGGSDSSFQLFESAPDKNLLFKDSTKCLQEVPRESNFKSFLGPDYVDAMISLRQCSDSTPDLEKLCTSHTCQTTN
nr:protein phosphatase 1 regulatory subunit 7 isoform X4 [Syngnathus scovelli]